MIRLQSLGECTVHVGDGLVRPSAPRLFALAIFLCLSSDRRIARTKLQRLLWPESEDPEAQHCLRQAIYRLNRMGAGLQTEKTAILLPSREAESDFAQLLACRNEAELERFAHRIQGPFLADYAPRLSEEFSSWLESRRDIATAAMSRALLSGIVAAKARGDWHAVQALSGTCLSIDPLNEQATLAAADCVALQGNKRRALSLLDRYVKEVGPASPALGSHVLNARRRIAATNPLAATRRRTPEIALVNRQPERAVISRLLAAARESHGSVLFLLGEMGIGKTRLLLEATRLAAVDEFQVATFSAQKHDTQRPLSVFADIAPALLGMRGAAGCSPDTVRSLTRLTTATSATSEDSTEAIDSELLLAQIRTGLFDLLDAISDETPLLIAVDNAHWIDDRSWEVLGELSRWTSDRRILVVGALRDSRTIARGGDDATLAALRIQLSPLSARCSADLIRSILASRGTEAESSLIEYYAAASGGNPLQLVALARHGLADGHTSVPPQAASRLLAERLARLLPVTLRTLQSCALLGNLCTLERLEDVLGERRIDLLAALDELERAGLVAHEGRSLRCTHEIVATAAVSSLSSAAKAVLHQHVAETLQVAVDGSNSGLALWEAARHWAEAGQQDRAFRLLRACARHCVEVGAPMEAARLLGTAEKWASGTPERIDLLEERLQALHLAECWDDIPAVLTQLDRLRQTAGSPDEAHSEREHLLLESRWRTGGSLLETYLQACDCAVASNATLQHRLRSAALALVLADNLAIRDRVAEVYESTTVARELEPTVHATSLHVEMVYHACFGRQRTAAVAADALLEHARKRGTPAELSRSLRHASIALLIGRSWAAATTAANEAYLVATSQRLANASLAAAIRLTELFIQQERYDDAETWYEECVRRQDRLRGLALATVFLSHGVELSLQTRDLRRAESAFAELRQRVPRIATPRANAVVRTLDMELKLARGVAVSRRDTTQLVKLHHRLRPFIAHDNVVRTLVRVLDARGEGRTADELAQTYTTLYRRELSELPPTLAARPRTAQPTAAPLLIAGRPNIS